MDEQRRSWSPSSPSPRAATCSIKHSNLVATTATRRVQAHLFALLPLSLPREKSHQKKTLSQSTTTTIPFLTNPTSHSHLTQNTLHPHNVPPLQ